MCQVPFRNAIGLMLMTIQTHPERSINVDSVRLEPSKGKAFTAKIFGFPTDFASQRGFCICQNVTMITLSVAGLLLLLNVALISSVLTVDQWIG